MHKDIVGVATRVHKREAARAFAEGKRVLVSEYGHQQNQIVTPITTVHDKGSTTWEDLVEQVEMWRSRYPNQAYYVVDYYRTEVWQ